jgi:hypothetical protein
MKFLQHVQPGNAITEFRDIFREAGPRRWPIALAAAVCTLAIFSLMFGESWKGPRALPQVIYINSWPEDRTEEETKAFIAENQQRKDANAELLAEREKIRRELWSALGRASGMDVDKMAAEAEAERAAEAARAKAAAEAIVAPKADTAPAAPQQAPVEP